MAKNLETVMLWDDACLYFHFEILPGIQELYEQDGVPDYVARCEEWNNWTDQLCVDGQISDWQYENWSQPRDCCKEQNESR